VHAGVGGDSHKVQLTASFGFGESAFESFVAVDASGFESLVDAYDFLVDDATGSDILVADFAVAHDSGGDSNV
jgi:hypothetical protein